MIVKVRINILVEVCSLGLWIIVKEINILLKSVIMLIKMYIVILMMIMLMLWWEFCEMKLFGMVVEFIVCCF